MSRPHTSNHHDWKHCSLGSRQILLSEKHSVIQCKHRWWHYQPHSQGQPVIRATGQTAVGWSRQVWARKPRCTWQPFTALRNGIMGPLPPSCTQIGTVSHVVSSKNFAYLSSRRRNRTPKYYRFVCLVKMALLSLVLTRAQCFAVNKYETINAKTMKSVLSDFYDVTVLSEPKRQLMFDSDSLDTPTKRRHIPSRRDSDGRLSRPRLGSSSSIDSIASALK